MMPSFFDMFQSVKFNEFVTDPLTLFSENYAVLSTGNKERGYNAMTVAWGTLGSLWEKDTHSRRLPVLSVYVRPERYTRVLLEKNNSFTVAFLNDRKVLGYLGTHSGRNEDKYAKAGITPRFIFDTVFPEESYLVFVCRKLYQFPFQKEGFKDEEIRVFNYPKNDYHIVTIGEITEIYERKR